MKIRVTDINERQSVKKGRIYSVKKVMTSIKTGKKIYITKKTGDWVREENCIVLHK